VVCQLVFKNVILVNYFGGGGGGGIEVAIRNRMGELDRTARSLLNNTTINKSTRGRGLEQLGNGVAALFLPWDFCRIFRRGGGVG
jgi:hypothetical protein